MLYTKLTVMITSLLSLAYSQLVNSNYHRFLRGAVCRENSIIASSSQIMDHLTKANATDPYEQFVFAVVPLP